MADDTQKASTFAPLQAWWQALTKREKRLALLALAAADTLGIVADPTDSFQRLLLGNIPKPTLAALRDNLRYFDIDKAFATCDLDDLVPQGWCKIAATCPQAKKRPRIRRRKPAG